MRDNQVVTYYETQNSSNGYRKNNLVDDRVSVSYYQKRCRGHTKGLDPQGKNAGIRGGNGQEQCHYRKGNSSAAF